MNKIIKAVLGSALTGAVLAAIVPAAVNAWGPSRTTFTIERPADYVTFNSITNNPNIGDERNFVGIRERGTNNLWSDRVKVEAGKEYVVRMYVHNNAGSNLNLTAEGVKAMINLPTTTGNQLEVNGFLNWNRHSSAPADAPIQIWDNASFYNDSDQFNMAYVPGSARYSNNAVGGDGVILADSVMTSSGVSLGYATMDGRIPGCMQYAGYLSIVVRPQFSADISISKTARKHTDSGMQVDSNATWYKNVSANIGDTIAYQLHVKNNGGSSLKNVMVRDVLPAGMEIVANSTYLYNSVHPNGLRLTGNILTGVNIGDYAVGGDAYVEFLVKVGTKDLVCGNNTLTNYGQVDAGFGIRQNTAVVTVFKECLEPVYTCDNLNVTKVNRTDFKFNNNYTAREGAQYVSTTFVVKDASGKEVDRKTQTGEYAFSSSNLGRYTVDAVVNVSVDGASQTVTSDNCKKSFEILAEDIEMCDIVGLTHLAKNDPDCKLPQTGSEASSILGSIVALVGLATSGTYYAISRKR